MNYYRKAWDIVGYTYHASAYCVPCGQGLPDIDPEGNEKHPMFASDAHEWACDKCGVCIEEAL